MSIYFLMHSTCQGFKEYDMKPFVSKKFVLTEVLKMKIETCYAWPKCKILQQKKRVDPSRPKLYVETKNTNISNCGQKKHASVVLLGERQPLRELKNPKKSPSK